MSPTIPPGRPLGRVAAGARPPAPVRIVHLGLGAFSRSHQAWCTGHAPDAAGWGIAAHAGRHPELADALAAQDGLYTVTTHGPAGTTHEVVSALSRTHRADDHGAWLADLASPDVAVVTVTVTEAGHHLGSGGRLDLDDPEVAADVARLRLDPVGPATTGPGRLLAGLAARRRADAGPIALVSCDNLPDNGAVLAGVLADLAAAVDPVAAASLLDGVSVVATVVDRITPAATDADRAAVLAATGWDDRAPVVTEGWFEWVLAGTFPASRPAWEEAGATFVDDVVPYQRRKLWLLNGGHSLLAYLGSARGHATVAEAVADDGCRAALESWWAMAGAEVDPGAGPVRPYLDALLGRFGDTRIGHRLGQVAADGSEKLRVRVVPVVLAARAAGRPVGPGALVLGAWVAHLRGAGGAAAPVRDPAAEELVPLAGGPLAEAVPAILDRLHPGLGGDRELVPAVAGAARAVEAGGP